MAVQVLPKLMRFFEGATSAVATPSGDARGHVRRADFMSHDLTGSARQYLR